MLRRRAGWPGAGSRDTMRGCHPPPRAPEPAMPWSQLPPYVSARFYALAPCLDRRLRGRFPQLLIGVLFAKGRRTCTAWFRAAGIAEDFRQAYRTVHAAGRHADFLATQVLPVVRPLEPGPRLAV